MKLYHFMVDLIQRRDHRKQILPYGDKAWIRRSFDGLRVLQVSDMINKLTNITEVTVDAGEPDEGDVIEALQER